MSELQGLTLLVLTDAESLLIRDFLARMLADKELAAYNRGVRRGLERIKAERGKR